MNKRILNILIFSFLTMQVWAAPEEEPAHITPSVSIKKTTPLKIAAAGIVGVLSAIITIKNAKKLIQTWKDDRELGQISQQNPKIYIIHLDHKKFITDIFFCVILCVTSVVAIGYTIKSLRAAYKSLSGSKKLHLALELKTTVSPDQ